MGQDHGAGVVGGGTETPPPPRLLVSDSVPIHPGYRGEGSTEDQQ